MSGYFCTISKDDSILAEGLDGYMKTARRGTATLAVRGLMTGNSPETVLDEYLRTGELSLEGCDGNFSLVLLDPDHETAMLYRHMVGTAYTFYTSSSGSFHFGSNLAVVARRSGRTLRPNEEMLPVFFIYRIVPGRNTLFDGIYKLLPGELVVWKAGKLDQRQRLTSESFVRSHKTDLEESVRQIETTLTDELSDWYARKPDSAVLLSGGVDSSLLQVYWNKIWREHETGLPPSTAIVLDHPNTKPDYEYTRSAVEQLETEHLNVRQAPLSVELMNEIFDQTGLMPNHVQSFYFATLAEGMKAAGFGAGICGEGADGLFGNSSPDDLLAAEKWKKKLPVAGLRTLAAALIDHIRPNPYLPGILRLANVLDDSTHFRHPENNSAAFTDFKRVFEVFGNEKTRDAMKYRRTLLDELAVPDSRTDSTDPFHLQRALLIGYFGEGIETSATWEAMFALHGLEMFAPFQDSRTFRVAMNIAVDVRFKPGDVKQALKKALLRHVPESFARRPKLGFGQPIFEWLSPGGGLREAVEQIDDYPWLPQKTKRSLLERKPTWFLWSLLCYDLWHKKFFPR